MKTRCSWCAKTEGCTCSAPIRRGWYGDGPYSSGHGDDRSPYSPSPYGTDPYSDPQSRESD